MAVLFGKFLKHSLVERKRILRGKVEYLRAWMDDFKAIERRGKKRKRDNGFYVWMDDGWKLLKVAENLLTQVEECESTLMHVKKKRVVDKLVCELAIHEKEGAAWIQSFSDEQGPPHGDHIPVKELVGRGSTLAELENLLHDPEVGQIAIIGRQGIGKSFMMKHLHNSVLKWDERFDYVFWVTSSSQFSIKRLQDALAAMVKCDLDSEDDLHARAIKLSNALASLGSFVLFLDGIPEGDFSLEQIGYPVSCKGSKCKLVLTTNSRLGCRMLDGFRTVKLDCLPHKEAFELFISEAKIDMASVTSMDNVPRLLLRKCFGIPHMIVNLASCMCGIDNIHEWRNALFEFERPPTCQVRVREQGA